MNAFKRSLLSLAAVLLLSGGALAASGSAMANTEDNSSDTTQASNFQDGQAAGSESETINNMEKEFRQKAEAQLQSELRRVKQHTETERTQSCDGLKNALNHRMSAVVSAATRHKSVFDSIYTKLKNFYTDKQLSVSNYAVLTAAADAAQTNAQASLDALKALDVNVDCSSQTVATTVSTFQQAVKSTHDVLQAYRTALVNLVTALKGASTSQTSKSTNNTTNQ